MDGLITVEGDGTVGLSVIDNNDVEHLIEMNDSGEITAHQQDGYPDKPAERTAEEGQHVAQARRYARYHVFQEREHFTMEPRTIPEWQAVVAAVVAQQPTEEFIETFGAYYQQFRSTVEDDVEPVIEVPESEVAGLLAYLQHIYLEVDLESVVDAQSLQAIGEVLTGEPDPDALSRAITEALGYRSVGPELFSVAGVSDVGAIYQQTDDVVTIEPTDSHDGPPDARLELARVNSPLEEYHSPAAFQLMIVHHLLCQSRDCYLQMGLEPPAGLRILGLGTFDQTVRNTHVDLYQPVHHTDADIDGYQLPDVGYDIEL